MFRSRVTVSAAAALLAIAVACSRQEASPVTPSGAPGAATDAATAADGSTLKVTAPTPLSPVNDQAQNGAPTLTASGSTAKFGTQMPLQYRFQVLNESGAIVQDSGVISALTFNVTSTLEFKKRHTWRVRAEYQGQFGPWSASGSFISSEGGYLRANEVFDPLYNGVTVGEVIGQVTFLSGQGARLDSTLSYVRYLIPQTITSGEFSMEIMGLRANAPGDKSKVFGMQEGTTDYITNPYRVDIQYRGTAGFPPNAITYRVLYGSETDESVRYEPTTEQRLSSVVALNPNVWYFWKYTWGTQVRVTVQEGGPTGRVIYDITRNSRNGTYNPRPHYAFIGTPTGRSGSESASIPGTIYRNVYIGARPRPF